MVIDEEKPVIKAPVRHEIVVNMDHVNCSVRELKELLTTAGVSFAGATEKDDLVRLLTKARAIASAQKDMFVPTTAWQRVPDGVSVPPGLEMKLDIASGANYARLSQPSPKPAS